MTSIEMFHTVEYQWCHQFCFKQLLLFVMFQILLYEWCLYIFLTCPCANVVNSYDSYNWWHQNIFFIHLFVANFVIEVVLRSVYQWHHFKRLYDNDIICFSIKWLLANVISVISEIYLPMTSILFQKLYTNTIICCI
jgi:hypothetical protein